MPKSIYCQLSVIITQGSPSEKYKSKYNTQQPTQKINHNYLCYSNVTNLLCYRMDLLSTYYSTVNDIILLDSKALRNVYISLIDP